MVNKSVHLVVTFLAFVITILSLYLIKLNPAILLSSLRILDRSSAAVNCTSSTLSAIGARTFNGFHTFSTEVGCIVPGLQEEVYLNDPQYTFYQVPSSLSTKAIAYIKTPNTSMMNITDLSWDAQITAASDVYIFYRKIPNTTITPPAWITNAYTRQTPDSVSTLSPFLLRLKNNDSSQTGVYDVYKYNNSGFLGVLHLAEAIPANNSFSYSMYLVGVVPLSAPTYSPTSSPALSPSATSAPSSTPNRSASPTAAPTRTPSPTGTLPPISGDFPCGRFPNASEGCMPVSYQSWFDNVPASNTTMNVNYTPKLLHQHYECAIPQTRANGRNLKGAMKISCIFVRYNSIVPFTGSNSGWYRSQNQGNTFEQFTLNLAPCQSTKYEGKECKTENVHTVRSGDFASATEMRYTPNANFVGMGGQRHFLSSNWQTGIGYRSSSELTTRYWLGECGTYQRLIMPTVDKFMTGSEPIATVRGTISVPFESNGGCGTVFKTFVFLDPSQHVTREGTQTGTTLFETNGHYKGSLSWDTTKTTNGVHSVLFINMEGTSKYVSASGIALRYNVQN